MNKNIIGRKFICKDGDGNSRRVIKVIRADLKTSVRPLWVYTYSYSGGITYTGAIFQDSFERIYKPLRKKVG